MLTMAFVLRGRTWSMRDLQKRLQRAIRNLDLGIPISTIKTNRLVATNKALREVGAAQVTSLDSRARLLRAVISLEEAL